MDMSCNLDVLVRQDIRPPLARQAPDRVIEIGRQTKEKMDRAFSGHVAAARRKA